MTLRYFIERPGDLSPPIWRGDRMTSNPSVCNLRLVAGTVGAFACVACIPWVLHVAVVAFLGMLS